MDIAREAALEAVRAVFSQGFAPDDGRDHVNLENTNTSHGEMDVRTSKGVSTDMASSFRERVYLGLDEDGNEIVKWASGSSRTELHDSIVRLYVKYGKIDRFLAEMRHPLTYESEKKVVLFRAQSQILCKLPTRREQIRIHCERQRIYPTAACVQYNAGGDGCQGRRQGRRSSERRAAARRPLTSGPGGVIRACVRQNRWTAVRESGSSPAAVPSIFS